MIACRSTRPAKIRTAQLCVAGVSVMAQFQKGFDKSFDHSPVEGSSETLAVDLVPISPRNSPEGYVLNRDDICRFFYPLPLPSTTLALNAKPDDVAIMAVYFDDSEQPVVAGETVQSNLKGMMDVYRERPGQFLGRLNMSVRALVTKLPSPDPIGKVNAKPIDFTGT